MATQELRNLRLHFGNPDIQTTIVKVWFERWKQRRALLRLDDRMLDDVGISKCQAFEEGSKPFWIR